MDHDRGKRGGRVKALDALKRCKYVALTAALGIVLLLLPGGNEKSRKAARRMRRRTLTARRCRRKWRRSSPRSTAWGI